MKKVITVACWGAAFAAGWLVGHPSKSGDAERETPARATRSTPREFRTWSPAERLEALKGLAALQDLRLENRIEMERHFVHLPIEEVRRIGMMKREDFNGPYNDVSEEKATNTVLRKWAVEEWCRRDPFGILDSGGEWFDEDLACMLRAAALIDPERARNHPATKTGNYGYRQRTALLQGLAEAAPEQAFAAASDLPQEEFEYMDLATVAESFHNQANRLKWLNIVYERTGRGEQQDIHQIMEMIAEDDPSLLPKSSDLPVLMQFQEKASELVKRQDLRGIPPGTPLPAPTEGDDSAGNETFCLRIMQWFSKDPAAVHAWMDDYPSDEARRDQISGLAGEATMRDLDVLDRMMETFTEPEDREAIQRSAVSLLSDGNTSTRAALLTFIGKHPNARQYVRNPRILEP